MRALRIVSLAVLLIEPVLLATPPAPTLLSPSPSSTVSPGSVSFSWALNSDPNGYKLSSYLLIKKRNESWDVAGPGDLGSSTSYSKTLDPGADYDWAVAAVDWGQHTTTWYQFSSVSSFATASTGTGTTKVGFRKPVDNLRDYNGTYSGVVGTGAIAYSGGTLYRDNYTSGNNGFEGAGSHPGVDIPVNNVPVYAVAYGEVIDAGYNGDPRLGCGNIGAGWGNRIMIKASVPGFSEPVYIVYGHLSAIATWVRPGVIIDDLNRSIGTSGNTGNSCGAHLHFQIDRHTEDSRGAKTFSHPYFPSNVNAPDSSNTVSRYTHNPLYLIQDLMRSYPAASTQTDPDQLAKTDILARAAKDSRFGSPISNTVGRDSTWGQSGQPGDLTNLKWLDFNFSRGRQVRLFHAVRNNNANARFTIYQDPDTGSWTGWVPAQ